MPAKKTIAQVAEEIFKTRKVPLHYLELTELVLEQLELKGLTPEQTIRSVVGHSPKFKRVAEGVYCPTDWEQFPRARFGKDIAYDVLMRESRPMAFTELGKAILEERKFASNPPVVARNSTRNDPRFCYTKDGKLVVLRSWLSEAQSPLQ